MDTEDTILYWDHYESLSEAELLEWSVRSPFFLPSEIACKGTGILKVSLRALLGLNAVRNAYNGPLTVNSAYRDFSHNVAVGGSLTSKHLEGIAFDLAIDSLDTGAELERLAIEFGFTAIGRYSNFIHIDMRPPKASGKIYEWGLTSWDS